MAFLFGQALTHTWNEQLTVIKNGIFTGSNGYPRGYVSCSQPCFNNAYLLPPLASGRTRVYDSDLLCAPTQRAANQTVNFPRLQVSPGSYVAVKYLDNATQPSKNKMLTDVLQWSADGTGGNQLGRLLTAQNFDNGRYYQINTGNISVTRQNEFPGPTPGQPGSINEQWCETDIIIPNDLQVNSTYTIYWVWQWPTEPGAPGLPNGKDEYYTTCSHLDIIAGPI
jgi:hypothetical protein